MGPVSRTCKRIADSGRFQGFIMLVIVANAATLGLATYEGIEGEVGSLLDTLDDVFIGVFVVELSIRILAYGNRPMDFFKDGWNVFDFVVLTLLLMFVYGMVGWILFHTEDPEQWANIGDAMLNLFVMLTLEDWPRFLEAGQAIHSASWIFFVSYILIASFLVINILLAIIINSMEEVREADRERMLARRVKDHEAGGVRAEAALAADTADAIAERVKVLRDALDALERDLTGKRPSSSSPRVATTKGRMRP